MDVGHHKPSPRGRHHQGIVGDPREEEPDVVVEVEVGVKREEQHKRGVSYWHFSWLANS